LESGPQLEALYTKVGSVPKLALHPGCGVTTVRRALDRYRIARMAGPVKYDDRDWFAERVERGMTVSAMAAELGCPRQSVYRALTRFGVPQAMKHNSC
jgi:hypothetical protein